MLAEPGCITYPHWDKFSTSTWISCLEGEIGFGWLAEPSEEEKMAWLEDVAKPKGRYAFKVLRPGDAVYMPPGTIHFVFRRPGGGQTMGLASQMLRRADAVSWLQHLKIELEYAQKEALEEAPYVHVVPAMVQGFFHLINSALGQGDYEKFGGRQRIEEMVELSSTIDDMIEDMRQGQRDRA